MEKRNEAWMKEEFTIMVDHIIGEFARCEFPNEEMKDVSLSVFPFVPKERERYRMRYAEDGNLIFVSRAYRDLNRKNRRIKPNWMRFSKRTIKKD